ncbi:MAG: hypothetical protein OQL19_00055 [Gammaproteobacteria bacterium]|nr:hypothetical protein [Gammaproteobacteria bacterium]
MVGVLIGFNSSLSDGSVAVIEDPSGAVFMIQKQSTHVSKGSK